MIQIKKQLSAFARAVNVDSTFAYMGSLMTFLAKGSETSGRFALMEYHTKPGNEPPPHVHEREHELYFVLEGTMRFYCEDKTLDIGAADVVFLPRGKAHAFTCTSNVVHVDLGTSCWKGCCRPRQLFPRDGRTGRKHGSTRIRSNVCGR
jgi:mannose-6-phosphate isomerase-like protein (cupin superfamily)